jgi:uncharacterized protein YmfQ (DUF2313 family)
VSEKKSTVNCVQKQTTKTKTIWEKSHIKTRFKKYKPGGQMGFPVS